jgi:hypothetical protein
MDRSGGDGSGDASSAGLRDVLDDNAFMGSNEGMSAFYMPMHGNFARPGESLLTPTGQAAEEERMKRESNEEYTFKLDSDDLTGTDPRLATILSCFWREQHTYDVHEGIPVVMSLQMLDAYLVACRQGPQEAQGPAGEEQARTAQVQGEEEGERLFVTSYIRTSMKRARQGWSCSAPSHHHCAPLPGGERGPEAAH